MPYLLWIERGVAAQLNAVECLLRDDVNGHAKWLAVAQENYAAADLELVL